jgi:hypothetical protein
MRMNLLENAFKIDLKNKKFRKKLWLKNRDFVSVLDLTTHYEVWNDQHTNVAYCTNLM